MYSRPSTSTSRDPSAPGDAERERTEVEHGARRAAREHTGCLLEQRRTVGPPRRISSVCRRQLDLERAVHHAMMHPTRGSAAPLGSPAWRSSPAWLAPTWFIGQRQRSGRRVRDRRGPIGANRPGRRRVIVLFHAVRGQHPLRPLQHAVRPRPRSGPARSRLEPSNWCVPKSVACSRPRGPALGGIPARLGFADVRNPPDEARS
jgi:hypothetical protein